MHISSKLLSTIILSTLMACAPRCMKAIDEPSPEASRTIVETIEKLCSVLQPQTMPMEPLEKASTTDEASTLSSVWEWMKGAPSGLAGYLGSSLKGLKGLPGLSYVASLPSWVGNKADEAFAFFKSISLPHVDIQQITGAMLSGVYWLKDGVGTLYDSTHQKLITHIKWAKENPKLTAIIAGGIIIAVIIVVGIVAGLFTPASLAAAAAGTGGAIKTAGAALFLNIATKFNDAFADAVVKQAPAISIAIEDAKSV